MKEKADPELWEARIKQVHGATVEKVKSAAQTVDQVEEEKIENPFNLEIKYGNRHRLIPNAPFLKNGRQRNHEWVCFVQLNNFLHNVAGLKLESEISVLLIDHLRAPIVPLREFHDGVGSPKFA